MKKIILFLYLFVSVKNVKIPIFEIYILYYISYIPLYLYLPIHIFVYICMYGLMDAFAATVGAIHVSNDFYNN